jgi:toxic protein SymE
MAHKPSQPARRQLKVYTKHQDRMYHRYVICPEIRLCGQWLQQMGFRCGHHVTVQLGPGQLIITLNPGQEAEPPPPEEAE